MDLNWTDQNRYKLYKYWLRSICPRYFSSFCWKIPEVVVDEPKFEYDEKKDPEMQMHEYRLSIILDQSDEQVPDDSEIQRKLVSYILTRTKQDFEFLYQDVKAALTTMCMEENSDGFREFLLENPWSVGVLMEIGSRLSIKALELNNFAILSIMFENDPNILEHKLDTLKAALVQQNPETIRFLISEDKYSAEEVSNILGSKEYYSSSIEVIDKLTEFLSESPSKLSAINYKAMFLYSSKQYEDAILLFEEVINDEDNNRQKQVAQFYKGLCLQYSGNSDAAIEAFQLIINSDIDEYYNKNSSIKDHAQEHLDSLKGIVKKKEAITDLQSDLRSTNNEYLKKYIKDLGALLQRLNDCIESTQDLNTVKKEIINTLSRIKFIDLKLDAPREIVSAQEFNDLPELYSQMTDNIDKEALSTYNTAIDKIDNTISLIGEITGGLIIEDVI